LGVHSSRKIASDKLQDSYKDSQHYTVQMSIRDVKISLTPMQINLQCVFRGNRR